MLSNLRNSETSWGVESPQYLTMKAIVYDEVVRLQNMLNAQKSRLGNTEGHDDEISKMALRLHGLRIRTER